MSDRNLTDWVNGFMALTENSEPPDLFRKWTAIATVAAALQRKCKLQLGISITIFPNLYIVLVGPPSTGKGTVMGYANDIIKNIPAIKLSSQATSLQALIRRLKTNNLADIDIETNKQLYHSSLTIFSEEFTVFLGYHNRELIAALCDWYDCKERWSYDTIKRDREEITGVWVNLLAGTTPDNIQSSFPPEAIGGGLSSRIIFINEEKTDKLVVFPTVTPGEIQLQECLINDLEQITLMAGDFKLTSDALAAYGEWCEYAKHNPPFYDKKFEGYNGRRRNHLLSLSMVCSASRTNEMIVNVNDVNRAISLLAEAEVKMGSVFRGIGKSDISSTINDAIQFLYRYEVGVQIPLATLARRLEGDVDKLTMDRVIQTLEMMNLIKLVRKPGLDPMIIVKRDG